jgi:signal transduction histidine kinase
MSADGRLTAWATDVRAYLTGSRDPRMAARAEKILVAAAVVMRGTFGLQLAVALAPGWRRAEHRDSFLALSIMMLGESLLLISYLLKRGRYVEWVAVVDIVFVSAVMVIEPLTVHPGDLVGSWTSWGYAAAFAAVIPAAVGIRRWGVVVGGAVFVAVAYLAGLLVHSLSPSARTTTLTDALSIVGFSVACRLGGGFVRSMGEAADRAREAEARAAAIAQLERERTMLHNQASVLNLLSQEIPDPGLRRSAMGAAARGAQQIRAMLSDQPARPAGRSDGRRWLRAVVDSVCEEFADLPLTRNLDLLEAGPDVPDDTAEAVAEALRTLLWNVRRHAFASSVTVHGDSDQTGNWTVSITDDGVGFDPASVDHGWGLKVQAGTALARHRIQITVDSAPGEGTQVQIASMQPSVTS